MNAETNKEIKRDKVFMYWINRILLPPAKAMFVLWTLAWMPSLPGDKETSFGQKIVIVLFGYFLMCGLANLIYASNKKRYSAYKMKITQKKIKRLRRIMYKTDPIKYKLQYGQDDIITEKKGFLKRLFHKEPSAAEKAKMRLDRVNELANIINSTYDFERFVNSYGELIGNMEYLQSIENLNFFTGRKPSEDLAEIREKRPLTEKDFVDRYLFQHGKENLESKKIYFDRLLPETVQYINTVLGASEKKHDKKQNDELDALDCYVVDAGRFVIEHDKASIGAIQRLFKIGFNRAARIMDILEEMGVVGPELGTAPRKVLVTQYEYEKIVESYHPKTINSDSDVIISNQDRISLYNNRFDYMEGHDFEYFCADILKKNGFENVEVTQGSGDHGIDILAEKDGITYAIQCKCYSSNIGNAAVQQAHTGKSIYHKDIAVVLTNRYFTAQAIEEAKVLGVKLWDRDKLNSMIEKLLDEQ